MTDSKKTNGNVAKAPVRPRQLASEELFRGERIVVITHSGELYRILITRNDKLILQK